MTTSPIVVEASDVTPAPRRAAAARRRQRAGARRERRAEHGPVDLHLWLPTTLIFTILAPFALIALPFLYLAPRDVIEDPARTIAALGRLLLSMNGTVVEVDAPDCRVHIRLF